MATLLATDDSELILACRYAEQVNQPQVWMRLAVAQLKANRIKEAVDAYINSDVRLPSQILIEVTNKCQENEKWEDLIRFLRSQQKLHAPIAAIENLVATGLGVGFAKLGRLGDLGSFLMTTNPTLVLVVADRCLEDEMYTAAKILYTGVENQVKLAETLVKLKDFSGAVNAALNACSLVTWKKVRKFCQFTPHRAILLIFICHCRCVLLASAVKSFALQKYAVFK